MPTSHWMQLNELVTVLRAADPKCVLDIGVGYGKFGVLAREYLELWDGRNDYETRDRRIDGIEIFSAYQNPIYTWVYDNVYYGDASIVAPELSTKYDLVLMIDVLEHFDRESGIRLLKGLLERGQGVLVSTPHQPSAQGAAFGNEHETHVSKWGLQDLQDLGFELFSIPNPRSLLCYMGKSAKQVCDKVRSHGIPAEAS